MCALLIPLSRSKPYDLPEPGKPFNLFGPWSTGWTTITRRMKETARALVLRCETAIRDEQACWPLALRVPPLSSLPPARKCNACAPFAADKEFSLCANYPKGHGELFREWMGRKHPGALLLHVASMSGARQDLCVVGAGAIWWNCKYWVEFLDERLRTPGVQNILQAHPLTPTPPTHTRTPAHPTPPMYLWLLGSIAALFALLPS